MGSCLLSSWPWPARLSSPAAAEARRQANRRRHPSGYGHAGGQRRAHLSERRSGLSRRHRGNPESVVRRRRGDPGHRGGRKRVGLATAASTMYETDDNPLVVFAWYKEKMSGWTEVHPTGGDFGGPDAFVGGLDEGRRQDRCLDHSGQWRRVNVAYTLGRFAVGRTDRGSALSLRRARFELSKRFRFDDRGRPPPAAPPAPAPGVGTPRTPARPCGLAPRAAALPSPCTRQLRRGYGPLIHRGGSRRVNRPAPFRPDNRDRRVRAGPLIPGYLCGAG